ncbi:MAG: hypothetical protein K9N10_06700 [Deltaproteobacteria bacterium]|nr:hypothetical protein [Deltaproteobacteria bacterium]
MKKCSIPPDIDHQIQGIAHQLAAGGEGENYPAAVMIVPTALKLKEFLHSCGLDAFLQLVDHYYQTFDSALLKEIVVILMSEAINEPLVKRELTIQEHHLDILVTISMRHIRRVLGNIMAWVEQSPKGKIILYQNLRMGGLYPPMEHDLKNLLAARGCPVFEVDLNTLAPEDMDSREIVHTTKPIRKSEEFNRAAIVVTRFKISSAPDPADSSHPEDFNSYASQENKLVALYALANLSIVKGEQSRLEHPIIMLDASKNALSLAQKTVKTPLMQFSNALDLMAMPFIYHHLYWIAAYGLNNLEDLLPASSPDRHPGKFYHLFARKVAEVLTKEAEW